MASNFDQKQLLEANNTIREGESSNTGKFFFWFLCFLTLGFLLIYYVGKKNWFETQRETILENLANIDAKLTERYNLLTNQLNVAKEAVSHERELQEAVSNVRASATKPQSDPSAIVEKDRAINGLTARWNMVQENYPDLKVMPVLQQLAQSVRDIEDDLQAQRRFYSAVAKQYNAALFRWPSNIAAASKNLKRYPMFEAQDNERANVSLAF